MRAYEVRGHLSVKSNVTDQEDLTRFLVIASPMLMTHGYKQVNSIGSVSSYGGGCPNLTSARHFIWISPYPTVVVNISNEFNFL